jgi:hypothetical protein
MAASRGFAIDHYLEVSLATKAFNGWRDEFGADVGFGEGVFIHAT